jgi:hypothetical protein
MDPPINLEIAVLPSCQRIDYPTGHDRFCQTFDNCWEQCCFERMEDEVPADQRADVNKTVLRLMLCRDPEGGYARYVCPGCQKELSVPFPCKMSFYPSYGKIKVDNWVDDITKVILEVPHLHITLTPDDSLRSFFREDSRLLNELLRLGAQAVQELVSDLYPGIRIGLIYTVHPAGRDQIYKPHVHQVMTKGGLIDGKNEDS